MIKFRCEGDFIRDHEWIQMEDMVKACHKALHNGTCAGSEYLGWVDHPLIYNREEYRRVKATANRIREQADALIVIGIGGSYLGARAVYEALTGYYPKVDEANPQLYFAGNDLSAAHFSDLLNMLEDKEVCVNVVSKSGTTLESAVAFRMVRHWLYEKYGEEAWDRIVATTDKEKGTLKEFADRKGIETFVVPDDIGGRYSVLTPVGLLPLAVAGIDIDALMEGAAKIHDQLLSPRIEENMAYQYAVARNILYRKGKAIDIFACYEPKMNYMAEWWKQLYGESDGKDGNGLFPASVTFTTDLHSLGQWIQDGPRNIIETVLRIEEPVAVVHIPEDESDGDGLEFINGRALHEINEAALWGTMEAHIDGGVPQLLIEMEKLDALHLGALIYFFEKACAMSGLLNGVNPFDQPGVEAYKKNLYRRLDA